MMQADLADHVFVEASGVVMMAIALQDGQRARVQWRSQHVRPNLVPVRRQHCGRGTVLPSLPGLPDIPDLGLGRGGMVIAARHLDRLDSALHSAPGCGWVGG